MFDVIGFVLYLAIGILYAAGSTYSAQITLGVMCLITALVFIVDLIVAIAPKLCT